MTKKILKLSLLFLLLISAFDSTAQSKFGQDDILHTAYVYTGLPGYFGVGYSYEIDSEFSVRSKISLFSQSYSVNDAKFANRTGELHGNFRFNTIDVLCDYRFPFANRQFRAVAGLSYLINAKVDGVVSPSQDATYGMLVIPKEMLGYVKGSADWSGISPYIGVGYSMDKVYEEFGWGADIGGNFLVSKAKVDFYGTNSLAPTATYQQEEFQAWVNKFWFMPTLMLHVNYKF